MKNRTIKIAEEMKKEISNIIQNELKDPRIKSIVSITDVNVTNDLKYATVYTSVLGDDKQKNEVLSGLKSAEGFVRREVGNRIKMRYTPEIKFELDNSIERGMYITKLINENVKKG